MFGGGKGSRRAGNLFFDMVEKTCNAGQGTRSGKNAFVCVRADVAPFSSSPGVYE